MDGDGWDDAKKNNFFKHYSSLTCSSSIVKEVSGDKKVPVSKKKFGQTLPRECYGLGMFLI